MPHLSIHMANLPSKSKDEYKSSIHSPFISVFGLHQCLAASQVSFHLLFGAG